MGEGGGEDLEEQLLLIQNEEGMGYIEGIAVMALVKMFVFCCWGGGGEEEDLEEQLLLIQNEEGMGYIEGITAIALAKNYVIAGFISILKMSYLKSFIVLVSR